MNRYKPAGPLLQIEAPATVAEEVPMRDLSRDTSEVLARVAAGRRAIVTKRGAPVAVIIEIEEALGLAATTAVTRGAAERRLFGDGLDQELRERRARALNRMPDRRRRRE